MKRLPVLAYALIGLAVVVWWALTQSWWAVAAFGLLVVVTAVHVLVVTSRPGSIGSGQDQVEGHARASFPMPPERGGF